MRRRAVRSGERALELRHSARELRNRAIKVLRVAGLLRVRHFLGRFHDVVEQELLLGEAPALHVVRRLLARVRPLRAVDLVHQPLVRVLVLLRGEELGLQSLERRGRAQRDRAAPGGGGVGEFEKSAAVAFPTALAKVLVLVPIFLFPLFPLLPFPLFFFFFFNLSQFSNSNIPHCFT